jgi:hypothetical protein
VPYRMTLDEVVALTDAFSKSLDIHARYSGAFVLYFLRLPRVSNMGAVRCWAIIFPNGQSQEEFSPPDTDDRRVAP